MPDPAEARGAGGPLVTVVIPARDAAATLAATIDSALAQTHRPLEILVVDDGSTDGTAEIARAIGDPVRVVTQARTGTTAACNTGFAAARGTVLALLPAGDRWDPMLVARCVDRLQGDPRTGLVTTDAFRLDGATPNHERCYDEARGDGFPTRDEQRSAIATRDFVLGPAVFDRRLLELAGGGFDADLGGAAPHELWTRVLLAGTEFALIPEPLAWCSPREAADPTDRLAALERHLPSLWLRGAHGRPQDAFAIARRVAARGERRLALWFVAHSLVDAGANPAQRVRYAFRGGWSVLTARRPPALPPAGAP